MHRPGLCSSAKPGPHRTLPFLHLLQRRYTAHASDPLNRDCYLQVLTLSSNTGICESISRCFNTSAFSFLQRWNKTPSRRQFQSVSLQLRRHIHREGGGRKGLQMGSRCAFYVSDSLSLDFNHSCSLVKQRRAVRSVLPLP